MDREADITKPVVAYSTYLQKSLIASKIWLLIVVGLSGISQGETQRSEMEAQPFPDISSACVTQISGAVRDLLPPAVHHLHISCRKTPLRSKRRLPVAYAGQATSKLKQYKQFFYGVLNILCTALFSI